MERLKREIEYLTEMLNDRLEDVGNCKDGCPYNNSCDCLIKQNNISLCGAMEIIVKNK
ncbi:hypothetical protein UT300012_33040 [Paraclostridium bifermentans]